MDATDRARLTANGYHIFRTDENNLTITEYTANGGWSRYSQYPSKAALHRAWKKLHEYPTSIGD